MGKFKTFALCKHNNQRELAQLKSKCPESAVDTGFSTIRAAVTLEWLKPELDATETKLAGVPKGVATKSPDLNVLDFACWAPLRCRDYLGAPCLSSEAASSSRGPRKRHLFASEDSRQKGLRAPLFSHSSVTAALMVENPVSTALSGHFDLSCANSL